MIVCVFKSERLRGGRTRETDKMKNDRTNVLSRDDSDTRESDGNPRKEHSVKQYRRQSAGVICRL